MSDKEKQVEIIKSVRLIEQAAHKVRCCVNEDSTEGAEDKMHDLVALAIEVGRIYAEPQELEIRPEVMSFARQMEERLRANDHKGGWQDMTPGDLIRRLDDEFFELWAEIDNKASAERIVGECADVANFCMMLADNIGHGRGR